MIKLKPLTNPDGYHQKQIADLLFNLGFMVVGVLLLIGPAIQNGFPILHSDSGSYLLEGWGNKITVSRPLSYCLFVRFSSYIFSVWSVVVVQALMVYWMIYLTINIFTNKKDTPWLTLLIVAILSVTTGLAFYTSQIMTDIFISIAMMAVFIILMKDKISTGVIIAIGIILWISLIVHMSNLPIITATSLVILFLMVIINRSFKVVLRRNILILAIVVALSWLTNPLISLGYGEGFRSSNSSSIVYFSRLLQAGAAQKYIHDKCEQDSQYYLCKYDEVIDGYNRLDIFLWNDTSFLYDHPCRQKTWDACWRDRNEEFGKLNSEILAYAPSRKIYLQAVKADFPKQLFAYELTAYVSFGEDSHIDYPFKRYYKNDRKAFLSSRQAQGTIIFSDHNKVITGALIFSLIMILALFIKHRKYFNLKSPAFYLIMIIFITWIINAALTAIVAAVSPRFTGRFIWLLPFLAFMLIYQEYMKYKNPVK